jgi:hypothetical protein
VTTLSALEKFAKNGTNAARLLLASDRALAPNSFESQPSPLCFVLLSTGEQLSPSSDGGDEKTEDAGLVVSSKCCSAMTPRLYRYSIMTLTVS